MGLIDLFSTGRWNPEPEPRRAEFLDHDLFDYSDGHRHHDLINRLAAAEDRIADLVDRLQRVEDRILDLRRRVGELEAD